jgi:hypothetical protein
MLKLAFEAVDATGTRRTCETLSTSRTYQVTDKKSSNDINHPKEINKIDFNPYRFVSAVALTMVLLAMI